LGGLTGQRRLSNLSEGTNQPNMTITDSETSRAQPLVRPTDSNDKKGASNKEKSLDDE